MPEGQKSFWDKPEGQFAKLFTPAVLIVLGILGFMFWGAIVPFVLLVLAETWSAICFGLAIAAVLFVMINPQWRALFGYFYKSLMRFMVGTVVQLDPIGIMKGYVADTKKTLESLNEQANKYDGQAEALKAEIDRNEAERIRSLRTMKACEGKPEARDAYQLAANQAGRLLEANKDLNKMYVDIQNFRKTIDRMQRASSFLQQDLENRVGVESRKRKLMLASYSIYKSFKRIMNDGSSQREMFDMALESNIEEYSTRMGEIKSFVKDSEGFLQGVDIQNGVYADSARDQMADWDKKSHEVLVRVDPSVPAAAPALETVPAGGLDDLFSSRTDKAARR
jgi:hypothetical protein